MRKQIEDILNQMEINIYMTDINTHEILFMNQKMKETYGFEQPEGKICWEILQEGLDAECEFCKIPELVRQKQEDKVICWREANSKTGKTFENYDCLIYFEDKVVHMQQSYDITNILQLSESASRDSVCGVWNREKGKSMLREYVDNLENGHFGVVAVLDVDDLKAINEIYGNQEGDCLLRDLCGIIQEQIKAPDFMFRLSGDQFAVVLKDMTEKEGVQRIGEWRSLVEQKGIEAKKGYKMTYSFGTCPIKRKDSRTAAEYLALADEKMYEEKLRRRKTAQLEENQDTFQREDRKEFLMKIQMEYPSELLYDTLIQSTDDYIYFCNMKTGVFRYSPTLIKAFDLPGQIVKNPLPYWKNIVHPEDWERFYKSNMEIGENKRDSHSVEFRAKKRNGEYVWLRCRGRLSRDSYGEPSLFAGIMTLMGRQNKVDPLTQLLNYNEFNRKIQSGIEEEYIEQIGIMVLDIDNFQQFNETYDRKTGDEMFRLIANQIQVLLPENGSLFRLDNDRLGVVFGNISKKEMQTFYSEIQKKMELISEKRKIKLPVTVSAGCVFYPEDGASAEELFRYADYTVQYAKKAGKNQMYFFDYEILKDKIRSLELSQKLRYAVSRGYEGFSLNYQPQVNAWSSEITGVEVLMRWKSPDGVNVSPEEFIPVMEENGMIKEASAWMMKTAFKTGNRWLKLQPDFSVSVNIAASQLMDEDFVQKLQEVLVQSGFPSENLIVELTESCAVQNIDIFKERFEELRGLGVRVAMDDFGTGYSSLGMLKNAPVDIVKIDRGFVQNILTSSFDATFISFVVAICHDVGIRVCLEGVETREEYEFIKPMNLDCIQGWYFGRPVAADEITRRLLEKIEGKNPIEILKE